MDSGLGLGTEDRDQVLVGVGEVLHGQDIWVMGSVP